MSQKYLNTNPIARMMSIETFRIFENESVDELIQKLSTSLFDIFKKVVVDFAPAKQRKMSTVKEKLKDTANSSSFKTLLAKMKDYAKETEIEKSSLADVKSMYIDAMEQLADAIKRSIEIDPKLEDKVIKYFQGRTSKYANSLEFAYKRKKEEDEELNESFGLGLKGRVEALKHKLRMVLVPESAGKTADNGYGRNWYRIFTELDQKLSAINHKKEISNDKEKKALKDLESQTDKLAKEFYTYCMRAAESPFKKILSDDEISNKFEDVKDLVSSAMDVLTRATVEESNVEDISREKTEGYDHKVSSLVFPLKVGDADSDRKFKGSLIIANLQKALINAFPPIKELLIKRGGADGKYNSAFAVAVKSLQGVLGNKNVSGEIDRALLDTILDADKIDKADKEAIADSLDILRKEYVNESYLSLEKNLNESSVFNSSEFFGSVNEASIHIDADKLETELEKYAKDLSEPENSKGGRSALGTGDRSDNTDQAYELAKLLRNKGLVKGAEEETFLREDGTLRASYSPEFMIAWTKTAEDAKEGNPPLYFWVDYKGSKVDGLYAAKRLMTNAKRPCNWPKWKEVVGDADEEDVKDFADWYTSYYSNFGGIDSDELSSLAKSIFSHNREEKEENSKTYDRLYSYFGTKEYKNHYLSPEGLEAVKSAFVRGAQMEEKVQDLSESDFGLLANLVAFIATMFTYDKDEEKFVSALDVILDEVLTTVELKKLESEEAIGSSESSGDIVAILDRKAGIKKATKQDKGSGESKNKKVFEENLKRAKSVHLPSVKKHIARMNAKTSDDLSRGESKGIFTKFISEAEMSVGNPGEAGDKFAKILGDHKDTKESPKGSNKGPEVSAYLLSTGLPGGNPWCMAFVYYVFQELSKALGTTNPLVKTAGVKYHWQKADQNLKIDITKAKADPNLIRPGQIFIMSRPGAGLGHTGIVLSVDPSSKTITTIEGNTNDQKSGEGDRVGINKRPLDGTPFLGFIDYFKSKRTPEFEKNIVKALSSEELGKISPLSTYKSAIFPEAGVTIPVGQEAVKKAWSESGEAPSASFDSMFDKFKEFLAKKSQ